MYPIKISKAQDRSAMVLGFWFTRRREFSATGIMISSGDSQLRRRVLSRPRCPFPRKLFDFLWLEIRRSAVKPRDT
jgi:hypothetical protein